MAEGQKKRHPLRFLLKLLVFVGLGAAAARVISAKKGEFKGITESEARAKFEEKLGSKIGEVAASEIADQVIPKLKKKGVIKPDPEPSEDAAEVEEDESGSDDGDTDVMSEAVEEVTGD